MHLDELVVKRFGARNLCLESRSRQMLSAVHFNQIDVSASHNGCLRYH